MLVQFDKDIVSKFLTQGLKVADLDSNMNSDTSHLHGPQKVIYSLSSISSPGNYRMKTTHRLVVKVKWNDIHEELTILYLIKYALEPEHLNVAGGKHTMMTDLIAGSQISS